VELEMCFYIGSAHQSSPPAPTKEGVYIQAAARRLYTRRLGGYMSQSDWNNEVQDLKNQLSSFGITNVDTSRYNVSGWVLSLRRSGRRRGCAIGDGTVAAASG
jgi:hypothetical protein